MKKRARLKNIWSSIGPGLITGAADDDPSGIATYTMTGAKFGLQFLWCAAVTWPLMAVVQMACARVGFIYKCGLAKALKDEISPIFLIPICLALFIANSLNVGADLAAMAESAESLTRLPFVALVIAFAIGITWATISLRYHQIAKVLKWLCFSLISYVIVALIVNPNWSEVGKSLFVIHLPQNGDQWKFLVAIFGTTISPYLFFWQASQEVEECREIDPLLLKPTKREFKNFVFVRRLDVGAGTLASNVIMLFVILTSALTLNRHGITEITSAKEAAAALAPLAGHYSALLYSLGIIGVGLLAIPTLTGSAAYALSEALNWPEGLDLEFSKAKLFYLTIIASTLFAVLINFSGLTPMKALYLSAVINGLLAPFLIAAILTLLGRRAKRRNFQTPKWMTGILIVTIVAMSGAAIGMFL